LSVFPKLNTGNPAKTNTWRATILSSRVKHVEGDAWLWSGRQNRSLPV